MENWGVEGGTPASEVDVLQRLKVAAVIKPRVAGPDPANPIWLHVAVQKPDARVHGCRAGPENGLGATRLRGSRQFVDGDEPDARRHLKRGGVGSRDRRLQVSSVDDFATDSNVVKLSGAQLPDLLAVNGGAQVLVGRQHAAPACLRQPSGRLCEVLEDLLAGRALVAPGVLADLVDAVLAKRPASSRRSKRRGCAGERTDRHLASDLPGPLDGRSPSPRRREARVARRVAAPGCGRGSRSQLAVGARVAAAALSSDRSYINRAS
jgi:hypothetical protein